MMKKLILVSILSVSILSTHLNVLAVAQSIGDSSDVDNAQKPQIQSVEKQTDPQELLQQLTAQVQTLAAQIQAIKAQQHQSKKNKLQKLQHAFGIFFHSIGTTLKYVVDKCDKLTSKKFIISALLIVGPAITAYCKYFNPELLHFIFRKSAKVATEGAMSGGSAIAQGAIEGIFEGVKNNPKIALKVGGVWLVVNLATKVANEVFGKVAEKSTLCLGSIIISGYNYFRHKITHR